MTTDSGVTIYVKITLVDDVESVIHGYCAAVSTEAIAIATW